VQKIKTILLLSKLCLILLILTFPLPVWAGSVYYVKLGGNDSADGLSDETAWATIAKVGATVTNGDTVYFRSQDTWTDATPPVLTATSGVTYDGASYGSGTRATLKATGDNTSGGAVKIAASNVVFKGFDVDGNSQIISGIDMCSYCYASFDNVTIDNCIVHDIVSSSSELYIRGIYVGTVGGDGYTVSNITIKNTTVHTTSFAGIVIYPTWVRSGHKVDTVLVQNCTVYNTGIIQWGNGLYVKDDADNVTLENNHLYGNDGGINIETVEDTDIGVPNNLIIRGNLIEENANGIVFVNRERIIDVVIYNNFVLNNGKSPNTYGSDLSINAADWGTSVVSVYNNTFYNTESTAAYTRSYFYSGWGQITGTPTFNLKNNIFYSGNYPVISICRDNPACTDSAIVHSNNLIYRSSGASDDHIILNYYEANKVVYDRDGTASDQTNWEATAQKTDPLFIDVSNDNYKIGEGSDAIDNGADLSAYFTVDYYGNPRPAGPGFDIGAHEYQDAVNTSPSAPVNLRVVDP
jgi:hypothetical protein